MDYFELLKAKRGLPVSDAYIALLGKKLQGGYPVTEIFGQLPFSFLSRGESISEWTLYGKTVQNGTPTPDSPIPVQGVSERTANLFDPNSTRYKMGKATDSQISPYSGGAMFYVKATPNTSYTLKAHTTDSTFVRLYLSNNQIVEGVYVSYNVISESETTINPEVTIQNTDYAYLWIQVGGAWYTEHGGSPIMLNIGSTALPNEPYGKYKIPILCGGTTQTVYLDKPLYGTGTNLDYLQRLADGTGVVHRACGVKVLDGTEEWYGSAKYRISISGQIGTVRPICTHYIGVTTRTYGDIQNGQISVNGEDGKTLCIADSTNQTSVEDWKSYLAAQYAAGTPVTVWYALETPTDTPVTLPEIQTTVGTNTLDTDTTVHGDARIKGRIKETEDSAMSDLLNLMEDM